MHDSWLIWKTDSWEEGRKAYPYLFVPYPGTTHCSELLVLISWCVASHGTHILSWEKSVQFWSLTVLSQNTLSHTKAEALPCVHSLGRVHTCSGSGPVPLVRVAFTPAKIDRTRSGCVSVTRSHLFRNAYGYTPPAHQVFNFWYVFILEGDSVGGFASLTEMVAYRWTDTPMHDVP